MAIPKVLKDLITAPGPSGYEQDAAAVFRKASAKFADVSSDSIGSTVARVAGKGKGPHVALIGHIDEIGLIIKHIDNDGFLWFTGVGGWDPVVLVAQRIEIMTKQGPIIGVIGKKPIHLLDAEERKKAPQLKDLHIDIGAKDEEEARSLVRIGDVGVIHADPIELPNNRLASRSLDNRIGCYVAYRAAELVDKAGDAKCDLSAVAAVQEEIGLGGSATTAYSLRPDIAIAIDVGFATDPPGSDEKLLGKHPFGSGPIVSRGSTLDPQLFELLLEAGDAEKIPYTIEASAARTGTDADAFHRSRGGIPTGLVSVPVRYMHSAVELCQLDDVENAARLLAAFVRRLPANISFLR